MSPVVDKGFLQHETPLHMYDEFRVFSGTVPSPEIICGFINKSIAGKLINPQFR